MPQLDLFASTDRTVVDGQRGRIVYTPRLVSPETASRWFQALVRGIEWKAERRRMYDREVDVPRLTAHFPLTGSTVPAIVEAAALVASRTGVPFNSVGLNRYRDGRDSVAPHNDHLHVLVEGFPIALVSLGATRRMTIRAKEPPREVFHLDLEAGSLLVMSYATQLHYTHGVPKTKEPVGERISLAFRVKPRPNGAAENDPYR